MPSNAAERTETTSYTPSRRSVIRAAAWTVPAVSIAVAAPAYAACSTPQPVAGSLDWDGEGVVYTRGGDGKSASALYSKPGAAPLTVTMSATYTPGMQPGAESGSNNNFGRQSRVGGLNVGGLVLEQSATTDTPQGNSARGSYTFLFDREVTNLTFRLTDIDSQYGDFWDVVQLTSGYSVVSQAGRISSDNKGLGGAPRFYTDWVANPADNVTDGRGNLQLRYGGPIRSFTITYWNGAHSFANWIDTDQVIYLTDMTFDVASC